MPQIDIKAIVFHEFIDIVSHYPVMAVAIYRGKCCFTSVVFTRYQLSTQLDYYHLFVHYLEDKVAEYLKLL